MASYFNQYGPVSPNGIILGTTGTLPKFTTPTSVGNSILAESSSVLTTTGDLRVTGTIDARYPDGEWRDLLVQLVPPNSGAAIPTLTQVGTSNMWAQRWALNDHVFLWFHAQHDIVIDLDIQLHVHWFTDGTNVNTVKWQWEFWHAKGHNQANFPFGSAGTIATAEEAYHGTLYRHMITESSTITITGLEPDSLIAAVCSRITNGGTNNTDSVFAPQADIHYRAHVGGTKNRTPNFYT